MNTYDIAIIGNGILGSTLSLELTKINKNLKILLLGPKNKFGSASVASGAMLNVFAEIENSFLDNKFLTKRFELGVQALKMWKNHHSNLEKQSKEKIEIKWGTYVINSSRGTKYEDRLFEYLQKVLKKKEFSKFKQDLVNPDKITGLSAQAPHRPIRSIKVEDGIVNSIQLLNSIDKIINNTKNIHLLDGVAKKINRLKSGIEIETNNEKIKASKIVLANGAYAQVLVDQIKELKNNTPRLFFGAGSAVILDYNKTRNSFIKTQSKENLPQLAIRTMDRGHACGLHLLPFKSHMYLGASSAIFTKPEKNPRVNSMAFMLNDGMNQIGPCIGRSSVKSYTYGFRPVSEDIFPMIGKSNIEEIWYLNGTKRDGLTISPYICSELAKEMLLGKSNLPKEFFPSRNLISYFNKDIAIQKSAIAQYNKENTHNMMLPDSNNFDEYFNRIKSNIDIVYKKYKIKNFGIHPELLGNYRLGIINKRLLKEK